MYESAHDSDMVPDTFNNFKRFCGIFSCALSKSSIDYRLFERAQNFLESLKFVKNNKVVCLQSFLYDTALRWGKIVKFGGKSFGFPKKATFLITYYYFCFPDIIKGIKNTNYKMFPLLIIV